MNRRITRWVIFLVIMIAVMAYVSWHGGDSAQWARSFLRHLLRALS